MIKIGDRVKVHRNEKGVLKEYEGVVNVRVESTGFFLYISGTYCYAWYSDKVPLVIRAEKHFIYQR
jgi:hypothetical protein